MNPSRFAPVLLGAALALSLASAARAEHARELALAAVGPEPRSFAARADATGGLTWWLPAGADALVLPVSAGTFVETANEPLMRWFRAGSPWHLSQLPVVGARYGGCYLAVIVPWPHYAELVVGQRVGVRFQFPAGRTNATPCDVVALWCGSEPLDVALSFRKWRTSATDTGALPRPRPLRQKADELPAVARLFGAPHIYLWGPALFCRHDVDRRNWPALARALRDAAPDTFAGRVVARFSDAQRENLTRLAQADWAEDWLTLDVAAAIEAALRERTLAGLPEGAPPAEVIRKNLAAFGEATRDFTHPPATWGDGFSLPMLESLRAAGVDRAVLVLSDFQGRSPRPELAARAAELGYLLAPYDSYHSVHDPEAAPDTTWETAQFDRAAFEQGRVLNADGSGHAGFKNRGYHFSPIAAWPYVRRRVEGALAQVPFSAWFVDCDATAECFDDYHPLHPASRVEDVQARRQRLRWLAAAKKLVVGSEEGSALFADVIHFGHGVQTPYLGHLAAEFKDPLSPSFLGRHWPPDTPAHFFKAVPLPPSLQSPYFDARARLPLYQAALGDEVVATHHWNFDSFKLSDVAGRRELMELLHLVPPLYHLNRETWPQRRERILRHFKFWSPLHRQLATASLVRFEWLTPDRLLQRTTFRGPEGDVTMTVNFSGQPAGEYPPRSATVAGKISVAQRVYQVDRD